MNKLLYKQILTIVILFFNIGICKGQIEDYHFIYGQYRNYNKFTAVNNDTLEESSENILSSFDFYIKDNKSYVDWYLNKKIKEHFVIYSEEIVTHNKFYDFVLLKMITIDKVPFEMLISPNLHTITILTDNYSFIFNESDETKK